MSWKEVNKVEQRQAFIYRYLKGETVTELCREYGISRKTGHKFIQRFKQYGVSGLNDYSRCPHRCARKTDEFIEGLIVDYKMKHPQWGPKKIKQNLDRTYPTLQFPAVSTIGVILERKGLRQPRSRRVKRSYIPMQLTESKAPNDIWCIDFKGQFQTRDGKYCYPLTISDHQTRYLIACECLEHPSTEGVYPVFQQCFSEYGLPKIIRSDNGSPFASMSGPYGLSRLSVWFLSLGIQLERIEPGHPEQNGRHERMHRTLKLEALQTVAANLLQQQEILDHFRQVYNQERPHEALEMLTPADVYTKSGTPYSGSLGGFSYPTYFKVYRVDSAGYIYMGHHKYIKISRIFGGHYLGLKELDHAWWVSFCLYDIGIIHKKTLKFEIFENMDD
jgi:putative transposase